MWASSEITVVEDGRTRVIETQASDVGAALSEAGVRLDDADVVTPGPDAPVQAGMTIVVRHAVPVVLRLGKETVAIDVVGERVADALVVAGLDSNANITVQPPVEELLRPGMTITVPDVFVRVVQEEVPVEPNVVRERDSSLERGTTQVVTKGRPGRMLRVYRVLVSGGIESTRVLSAEKVVEKPVDRIVAVGTGSGRHTSVAKKQAKREIPSAPRGGRRMRVEATGYSAKQPELDDWTATGAKARHGVIAVDPRVIPLGTRVYVPGYGYAVAADTGGAIRGARIDLCFDTVAEARIWGRRHITIIVLGK